MANENYYNFVVNLVREAGKRLRLARNKKIIVFQKGDDWRDVVTNVDIDINDFLASEIKKTFPGHRLYSEEQENFIDAEKNSPFEWAIDPIDGSANFSRGIPHFSVCVGLLKKEVSVVGAVYNPVTDEFFSFEKGRGVFLNNVAIYASGIEKISEAFVLMRVGREESLLKWGMEMQFALLKSAKKTNNWGSAALDLCFLAAGRVEAVIYGTFSAREMAGAVGILRAAGGEVYTLTGQPVSFLPKRQTIIAAANKKILAEVLALAHSNLLPPLL